MEHVVIFEIQVSPAVALLHSWFARFFCSVQYSTCGWATDSANPADSESTISDTPGSAAATNGSDNKDLPKPDHPRPNLSGAYFSSAAGSGWSDLSGSSGNISNRTTSCRKASTGGSAQSTITQPGCRASCSRCRKDQCIRKAA